jgi:hypothetical protein
VQLEGSVEKDGREARDEETAAADGTGGYEEMPIGQARRNGRVPREAPADELVADVPAGVGIGEKHREDHLEHLELPLEAGEGVGDELGAVSGEAGDLARRGGTANLFGTVISAFLIAQTQAISEFFMDGSNGRVLTYSSIVLILMFRPQGLFASKVRR